jgi:hypothetical protein
MKANIDKNSRSPSSLVVKTPMNKSKQKIDAFSNFLTEVCCCGGGTLSGGFRGFRRQ